MSISSGGDNGRSFGGLTNIADIGDIITVKGYNLKEFQVESWTHEVKYQTGCIDEVILYDVTDLKTHYFLLAYQEDVSVICRANKADAYLRNIGIQRKQAESNTQLKINSTWEHLGNMSFKREEVDYKANKKVDHAEEARVDRFLDEIIDYKELIKNFGDVEGEYQAKIDSAKSKLTIIAEGGR